MNAKTQHPSRFSNDPEEQRLAHISLTNVDLSVVLYAEDLDRLTKAGFSLSWKYNEDGRGNGYPTVSAFTPDGFNREVAVARLVAEAPRGKRVRPRDGDSLNLRRDNLGFERGAAWYGVEHWSPSAAALRASGAEPASKEARLDRRTRRIEHSAQMPSSSRRPAVEAISSEAPR
jgi:hypothetical protein